MSYASGFAAGMGQGFGQKAKSMLEAELSRYKGLAKVYETIANNPDTMAEVKQEALRRMSLLSNVDPYNPATLKNVKGFEDTSALWKAHDALRKGSIEQPSLSFQAAASGSPAPQSLPQAPQQSGGPLPIQTDAVRQSVGAQPGGVNDPKSAAVAMGQQLGLEPTEMESIAAEVTQLAGPEPQTSGLKTDEWKQWFAAKQQIAKEVIEHRMNLRRMSMVQNMFNQAYPAQTDPSKAAVQHNQLRDVIGSQLGIMSMLGAKGGISSILNPPQTHGGVWFMGPNGIEGQPGAFVGGQTYAGQNPVQPVTSGKPNYTTDEFGHRGYDAPGVGFQPSNIRMPIVQSATDIQEDAISGQRHSQTRRSLGAYPGAGNTIPPVGAQLPQTGAQGPPATTDTGGNPSYAERKLYFTNPTFVKKYGSAVRGLGHVTRIVDKVEEFYKRFGTSPTGPITGRFNELSNILGWGDAIDFFAQMSSKHATGQASTNDLAAAYAQLDAKTAQLEEELYKSGDSAAEAFAEIITLTRSLNGLELISMSGSGNGITRLYQMMERALLNPYQDPKLLRGHARGVGFLFEEIIKETLRGRGQTWKDLDPEIQQQLEKIGLANEIPGYTGENPNVGVPDGVFPSGPLKGKTRYRYPGGRYSPNPTAGPGGQ